MATVTGTATISGLNTAKTLGTIPANTDWCILQPVTQNVRMTLDGTTTPTPSVGLRLVAGTATKVRGFRLSNVKLIEETASATVNVTFVDGNDGDVALNQ